MSKVVRLTERQLKSVIRKLITEQVHSVMPACRECGDPLDDPSSTDPSICFNCEMEAAHPEGYFEKGEGWERSCPQCGSPMDPNAIEDNPGGFCDSCSVAEEEGENYFMRRRGPA